MALYHLAGMDELNGKREYYDTMDTIGRRKRRGDSKPKQRRSEKKAARKQKRTTRRTERKAKGGVLRKVKKVGLAPSRIAFLGLVRVNAMGLAKKLVRAYRKNPGKLEALWVKKLGGKWEELKKTIAAGSKEQISGIGAVSVAAALATATPILILTTSLLKELGVFENRKELQELEDAAKEGTKQLAADGSIDTTYAEMPEGSGGAAVMETHEGGDDYRYDKGEPIGPSSGRSATDEDLDEGEGMSTAAMVGLGLLGAGVIYMAVKK